MPTRLTSKMTEIDKHRENREEVPCMHAGATMVPNFCCWKYGLLARSLSSWNGRHLCASKRSADRTLRQRRGRRVNEFERLQTGWRQSHHLAVLNPSVRSSSAAAAAASCHGDAARRQIRYRTTVDCVTVRQPDQARSRTA